MRVARIIALVSAVLVVALPAATAGGPGKAAASLDHDPVSPSKPPLPLNVWGTVIVNGAPAAGGTLVSAWCDGMLWDTFAAELFEGEAWYQLGIPGDDPATTDIVEGCASAEMVTFTVGGILADQSIVWAEGENERIDLTTIAHYVYLPLVLR